MTPLKEASLQIVQICIHLKHSFKLLVYPQIFDKEDSEQSSDLRFTSIFG